MWYARRRIGLLVIALLTIQIFPIQYIGFSWLSANAAADADALIDLTYPNSIPGFQSVYKKDSSATTDIVTIPAVSGKTILDVGVFRDGIRVDSIPAAVGQSSWTGQLSYWGSVRAVESRDNYSAKGYYAWYRYIPGGSQGVNWYADLPNVGTINCGGSLTESINGYNMPKYPGCSGDINLELSANRAENYTAVDSPSIVLSSSVVAEVGALATATVDNGDTISGPPGLDLDGQSDGTTTPVSVNINTADSFTVKYTQRFDHISIYNKELNSPPNGAKVMVYFAAFKVTITSKTFMYPDHIVVTYSGGTQSPTPSPTPPPISITGDFQLAPSTINYRDTFKLHPLPFTIPSSCSYTDHYYKIERGGNYVYTPKVYSKTQDTVFIYSSYPSIIAVGSHNISLMIEASCGSSGFIATKTLTVNGPSANGPPDFKVAWVNPSNRKLPLSTAVVGTTLDLIYIEDPTVPTPSDPDGDIIFWDNFNFNTADTWTKTVPSKSGVGQYTNGYHNVLMDTVGFHYVSASFHDQWGLSTTRQAMIEVVPPNPVPVCKAPSEIKENRTVTSGAINSLASYSPLGRTIDHTKDVWTNLKTSYVNGSSSDIVITVTLQSVTDSAGLTSLSGSDCQITIHPDLPPVGKLGVPSFSLRNTSTHIQNQSYSTDGDSLVSAFYTYKYDVNNDGFQNDAWQTVSGGNVAGIDFTPSAVGKYLFNVKVCEDFGRCGDNSSQAASEIMLDVVNKDGPVVSFEIAGENTQPTVVPATKYNAGDILKNWILFQTNTSIAIGKGVGWSAGSSNQLIAGLGRNERSPDYYNFNYEQSNSTQYRQFITPAQDFGLGANGQSPYRSFANLSGINTQPILVPSVSDSSVWQPVSWGKGPPVFQTTEDHIYFGAGAPYMLSDYYGDYRVASMGGYSFYSLNKQKLGRYSGTAVCNGCYFATWEHKYLDGSPYDYILTPANLLSGNAGPVATYKNTTFYDVQAAIDKNYTRAYPPVDRAFSKVGILGYKVVGQILYMKVLWNDQWGYAYNTESGYGYLGNTAVELRTYNVTNGQFISSSLQNGNSPFDFMANNRSTSDQGEMTPANVFPPQSIGNDLVDMVGMSYYGDETLRQINPQGQVVKSVQVLRPTWNDPSISSNSVCNDNIRKSFRGADGEFYFYASASCSYTNGGSSYSANVGTFVIKINADLSFGWRTKLKGSLLTYAGTFAYAFGDHADAIELMIDNPARNQMLVRSYNANGYGYDSFYESLDKATGSSSTTDYAAWTNASQPTINWDGSYSTGVRTIDGYSTTGAMVKNEAGTTLGSISFGGTLALNGPYAATTTTNFGTEYVGDGMLMALLGSQNAGYDSHNFVPWLAIGTPSNSALVGYPTRLGQFVSNFTVSDAEIQFTLNLVKAKASSNKTGFSFRMQDPRNRYAVETNGTSVFLTKYVNGVPTILSSANYPFLDNTDYTFSLEMLGSKISLKLNGVPYLSVQDSTWLSGTIGPVTDKSYATFSNITRKAITSPQTAWYAGYALWEGGSATAAVKYDHISYTDSENDPASGSYQWYYKHTPKFLNNQGISVLDGQTFSGSQTTFDKVGVYKISLSAKDDPNPAFLYPSVLFELYRKASNTFHASIVVHRRPVIPNFTSTVQGDGTVVFTDDAYDPDRYQPVPPTCSAPDVTGLDYCANHGVLSRQYSFVDPNGNYSQGKPSRPSISGTYTVYLQVMDEYGALSQPVSTTFTATTIVAPALPPVATLTFPNGTQIAPTIVGVHPTITWNQVDPNGFNLTGYEVRILDEYGAPVTASGMVSQNKYNGSQSWDVPLALTLGVKYQVQVRVEDIYNWSAWSNIGWMQVNSPPSANMTVPNGTKDAPDIVNTVRPTLRWNQSDPDPGTTFQYFQIQITNEANTVMIMDSGQYWQGTSSNLGSWTVNQNLPAGQKLRVRVRVFDGISWSNYSPQTWLYINRAPIADFDWQPKPVWEGDMVQSINVSTDPDGDALSYTWLVEEPGGGKKSFTSNNFTHKFNVPGDYKVTLTASDVLVSSTVIKTITALPLTIHSDVTYTDKWLTIHKDKGHQTEAAPKQFYSGEIFIVKSQSALTSVEEVTAWMDTVSIDGYSLYVSEKLIPVLGDPTRFTGELFDQKFQSFTEGLPRGLQTVHFQIRYSNGVVKKEDIPIEIIGNVQQSVGVHRVQ
ncbi:hypothetical protein A8709_29500 [Paenibacillus pectinilyticus]|uniref:PKD domain-containing protein n=1 Tax=Paenibacillus pectinilyticus TaxID=512399 RepID=A0A1C0ZV66_9BACL|nr:PKD domain-containing protein [Paenibacillus pectinilyticus]OCT11995.1 hypothetical protein A8709_29500 [Paenibacillus pectinilyticus]